MQERRHSIANALDWRLSCTNPSIWRSGTYRFPLWVPNLKTSCRDLITWQGARIIDPVIAAGWHPPLQGRTLMQFRIASGPKISGPRFNIKISSYQYRKSHCGDKTLVRSSYLHNSISYTGKISSLYWFSPLGSFWDIRCKKREGKLTQGGSSFLVPEIRQPLCGLVCHPLWMGRDEDISERRSSQPILGLLPIYGRARWYAMRGDVEYVMSFAGQDLAHVVQP